MKEHKGKTRPESYHPKAHHYLLCSKHYNHYMNITENKRGIEFVCRYAVR